MNVDLFSLFLHFLTLSLLSIGGAITTVPEMHRFLVDRTGWLTDESFTSSIALAQAAPRPPVRGEGASQITICVCACVCMCACGPMQSE